MILLPKANRTALVRLLRAKGFQVPSLYQAAFSHTKRAYWLHWTNGDGTHTAYYSGVAGRPMLLVDKAWIELTMAEVIHLGRGEEK